MTAEFLRPLRIGPVPVDFPVVLAALAGFSDASYRLLCRSLSAPYCTTEAMLDSRILYDGAHRPERIRPEDADHPIAGQIMGSEPKEVGRAAAVLAGLGYDVIDLNFACPARKIVSRKRGGYLMSRPEHALEIVDAVLNAVPDKPVTLKLRRAFRDADRLSDNFWRIAEGAFQAGVAGICVHARSVEQKYTGSADWEFLAGVKRAFPDRTVVGSGDALTAAEALRMIRDTGVDAVSAARGAIGKPWLFLQARDLAAGRRPFEPTLGWQRTLIENHLRLACRIYGPRRGPWIMRNFLMQYVRVHPRRAEARQAVLRIMCEEDALAFLDAFYGSLESQSPDIPLARPDDDRLGAREVHDR
jgi:tRNA-dihydrouridine synthase B